VAAKQQTETTGNCLITSGLMNGVQAEPDYEKYYYRRAIYLLPRWFGGRGEWEADLALSTDFIGGEQGDMIYAQVVWDVQQYDHSPFVFQENKLSWPRTKRGFEIIEKHFPNSLAAQNELAQLAALAGDRQTARKSFEQLNGKMDPSVWKFETNYFLSARWAYNTLKPIVHP
jgi:hypothetical protein